MAEIIRGHLYRVSLEREYNYSYIAADDLNDLIRYLADNYTGKRICGVKEIRKDGSLHTVQVLGTQLFDQLTKEKIQAEPYLPTEIDNQLWAVMLPTGGVDSNDRYNQWELATRATAQRNDLFHYHTILTLCQDQPEGEMGKCIGRGCVAIHYRNAFSKDLRHELHGYRPVLIPLDSETLQPDLKRLETIRDGTRLTFGTLYMDDVPLHNPKNPILNGDIPHYQPGAKLRFNNTSNNKDYQVHWVKVGGTLICDRNLVQDLSWNDLNRQSLVLGKRINDQQMDIKPDIQTQLQLADHKNHQQGREDLPAIHKAHMR